MSEDFFGGLIGLFFFLCVGLPLFAAFIYSVFWAYQDAEKRGKSGCLVALLVLLLSWPVGLILWLVVRPEHKGF
jgi:hypothetical protein